MTRMGILSDNLRHLPTLKNSPKAVATTKRGNVPFNEADLAALILSTVPVTWQNQYNLTHQTVPESPLTLLQDLENIKCVMSEKFAENLRAKVKSSAAKEDPMARARNAHLGAALSKSQRKFIPRSFASIARLTVDLTRCSIPMSVVAMTRMVSPPARAQVSPLAVERSPTRNLGATTRAWLICQPCLRPT